MNFKNIILVIAIIVVVIGAAAFLMSHKAHPKDDSRISMVSASNLTEGDNFTVKLTDINGTALPNQNLNIIIVGDGGNSTQMNLTTNSTGEASFELDGSTFGNCAVKVKYSGNDKYNGCNFTDNIRINQKVVIIQTNQTTFNNTTNNTYTSYSYYDDEVVTTTYNEYYQLYQ